MVKVVVLDKSFCIIQNLIELIKVKVFAATVIKKQHYWHRHINYQEINNLTESKDIVNVAYLRVKIEH